MLQAPAYSYGYEFSLSALQNGRVPSIDQPDLTTIGGRVAYVRGLRGLSQSELARRAKCSQPTIWALENPGDPKKGTKDPSAWLVYAVAAAIDTTMEFLLRGPTPSLGVEASVAEAEIVALYRSLGAQEKFSLLEFARHLKAGHAKRGPGQVSAQDELQQAEQKAQRARRNKGSGT